MNANYSQPLGNRLPSVDEQECANQLRRILASQMADGNEIRLQADVGQKEPAKIALNRPMAEFLIELLRILGRGDAVTIMPVEQLLTTQQAADLLNVSRPYLITSLLDTQEIPFQMTGRHRRVRAHDVFEYTNKMRSNRETALSRLAEADADLL